MQPYQDPIIQRYIKLIKDNHGDTLKGFYEGDPIKIPASMLPCCIISKNQTRAGQINSADDAHDIWLTITIITDIRQDLSTQDIAQIAPGVSSLYQIVEGRDSNYKLLTNSILNILRTNQLLDVANNLRTDLTSVTRVDYGQTLRQRNPEMWSTEARIEIVANFIQLR
jgi:hypothetical protein